MKNNRKSSLILKELCICFFPSGSDTQWIYFYYRVLLYLKFHYDKRCGRFITLQMVNHTNCKSCALCLDCQQLFLTSTSSSFCCSVDREKVEGRNAMVMVVSVAGKLMAKIRYFFYSSWIAWIIQWGNYYIIVVVGSCLIPRVQPHYITFPLIHFTHGTLSLDLIDWRRVNVHCVPTANYCCCYCCCIA